MGKKKNKFNFDSENILFFVISKSKILFTVAIAAFIISTVVSFLITPKFKSTVILFPAAPTSISKSILNTQYIGDVTGLGHENECDQLLQVLLSDQIKDLINKKYNLMAHYGIDSLKTKSPRSDYYGIYNEDFSIHRSEYLSIVIDVLDRDPKLAAAMANDVAAFADTVFHNMQKARSQKAFEIAKREYFDMDSLIKSQEDSVNKLRLLGALNYEDNSLVLRKQYYKALIKGRTDVANLIDKQLDNIRKYAKVMGLVQNKIADERVQFPALSYKYEEARVEYLQDLPNKFVVQKAQVPEKKSSPKRMLIVLTSTISAICFAFMLILITESFKKII